MEKDESSKVMPAKIWDSFKDIWDTMPSKSEGRKLGKFHSKESKFIVGLLGSEGKPGDRIIDIGCGKGRVLSELGEEEFKLYGVDVSSKMLKEARANVPKATFKKHNIKKGNPFDKKFDFVMCTGNTLGNIKNPEEVVENAYKMLDEDGVAIFGVYNADYLDFDFVASYYAKLHSYYGPSFPFHLEKFDKDKHMVKYREGLFSRWFEERDLKRLMRNKGFDHVRILEKGIGLIAVCRK